MNETAITTMNASAQLAICKPDGSDYSVSCGIGTASLKRDVDFGVVPGTKSPSLYKSGAEKICMAYGLLQQFDIESKIENPEKPLFYYLVRCRLVKVVNGIEYVFSSGYGSGNTSEKRNGRSSPFDAANATLKMAEKRALVDAALHISGLSDAFTQDMENETFMQKADLIVKETPESPITAQQIKRLFAVAGDVGLTQAEAKKVLADMGYASTKAVLQKDYNAVIDSIQQKGKTNG